MTVTLSNALYIGNTMVAELRGLQKQVAGTYANSASLTITIEDTDGNDVSGETWPVTMSYVSGSDGIYRANLSSSLGVTAGENYVAHYEGSQDGLDLDFRKPIVAQTRETT